MNYIPHHPQPFTLAEATQLEIPVITEEIARLQNSLDYLHRTQNELKEFMNESGSPDADLEEAYADNTKVIASQQERITILKMALSNKGIPYTSHYDVRPPPRDAANSSTHSPTVTEPPSPDDGGLDL